jgi:heat shock protein HtpX
MAAYGLYTHIAANKTRSMLLLGGLFVLVYVMVYAGADRRGDDIRRWRTG